MLSTSRLSTFFILLENTIAGVTYPFIAIIVSRNSIKSHMTQDQFELISSTVKRLLQPIKIIVSYLSSDISLHLQHLAKSIVIIKVSISMLTSQEPKINFNSIRS
jgi:hypothetical protein